MGCMRHMWDDDGACPECTDEVEAHYATKADESKPRHWFIQKPTAHNCPYRTNGAVFQEFEPTITDHPGGEWIKVWSSADLSKRLGMGVTRWVEVCDERNKLAAELEDEIREYAKLERNFLALEVERDRLFHAQADVAIKALNILKQERDEARAEVERLRTALEEAIEFAREVLREFEAFEKGQEK